MITSLIFALHFIFALVICTKKWQVEGVSSALINLILIIVLFSVGWSVTTMLTKLFINPEGLGIQFDRDTISLTILSIVEYFFYKFYYGEKKITEDGKEKQ